MGLIKISFIISFILCLIWIFWIEKHVNRSGKILLVILFGFSAFISFVKHLENLIVIFFMLAIGITYSCIYLVWTYICKNEKNVKLSEIDFDIWLRLLFVLFVFWTAWIVI